MASGLVEAWRMGNEANLFVLSEIPPGHLADRYDARTRTVAGQFAHIHNTRLRWLRHAGPKLAGEVQSFERGAEPTKAALKKALKASEKRITAFIEESEAAGKVKSWKGSPATFLAYLIAHEAHHRGLAMVALRLSGHKPTQELVYGQWQWGKQRSMR